MWWKYHIRMDNYWAYDWQLLGGRASPVTNTRESLGIINPFLLWNRLNVISWVGSSINKHHGGWRSFATQIEKALHKVSAWDDDASSPRIPMRWWSKLPLRSRILRTHQSESVRICPNPNHHILPNFPVPSACRSTPESGRMHRPSSSHDCKVYTFRAPGHQQATERHSPSNLGCENKETKWGHFQELTQKTSQKHVFSACFDEISRISPSSVAVCSVCSVCSHSSMVFGRFLGIFPNGCCTLMHFACLFQHWAYLGKPPKVAKKHPKMLESHFFVGWFFEPNFFWITIIWCGQWPLSGSSLASWPIYCCLHFGATLWPSSYAHL